ncbi:hypothetical protein Tco_0396936 [Tanacetum coccineum]
MLSKSKSPDSAGASSAQTSSMTAPASNPTSTTDTPPQRVRMTNVELLNAINTGSPDATRFLTVVAICNTVIPIKRNLVASLLSSMKLGINESPRLANIVPGVFRRALREG